MSACETETLALQRAAERLDSLANMLERFFEASRLGAGNVQQVTMPQAPPLPPPSRGERAAWFAAMVTVLALAVVVMQGQRISDMRAAMAAEAAQRAAHEAWAREEANILRGYIWTGKVPVANPYPKPEQPK
jgi:hypothetical protein